MAGYNRVILMGNLTRDPLVRQVGSGISVADLRLAVSERYRNREGEQVETTCFVDIAAWGRQAETCGQYLRKGAPVLVEGRLQYDQWEADDGTKRSRIRVRADRVNFLSRRASSGGADGDAEPAAAERAQAPRSAPDDENLPF